MRPPRRPRWPYPPACTASSWRLCSAAPSRYNPVRQTGWAGQYTHRINTLTTLLFGLHLLGSSTSSDRSVIYDFVGTAIDLISRTNSLISLPRSRPDSAPVHPAGGPDVAGGAAGRGRGPSRRLRHLHHSRGGRRPRSACLSHRE